MSLTVSPQCPACGGPLAPDEGECPACVETRVEELAPDGRATYTGPRQLAGYRIERELGAGGMGTVFEAWDEKMERRVALKVMSRHLAPSEKAGFRFEQEAWIAGKLSHPNVVKVFDRGQIEDLSFYSMELVDGGSLADVVRNLRRWGRDDRWKLERGSVDYVRWAITRVIDTARALHYAHQNGVVHRDIKPVNLLLSGESCTVKIADFGLAIDAEMTRLTSAGKALGTLSYMAPEQILGKQDEIDRRTDVFALGVTLFELLTLELPYHGGTQQLYMSSVLTDEARRPSKLNERVGRDLEIVIRKCLEKSPQDRYPSAAELADDLENVLHLRPIVARPTPWSRKIVMWARRRPMRAALIAVLVVGLPTVAFLTDRTLQHRQLVRTQTIESLWEEARMLARRLRRDELVATASEILVLDPAHVQARRARAVARLGLIDEQPDNRERLEFGVLADIEAIIQARPGASWPYRLKAFVLESLGRADESQEAQRVAERRESDPPATEDLEFAGLEALDRGAWNDAEEIYTELMARKPDDPLVFAYRGEAKEELGKFDEAENDYRLAVALRPGDLLNHYSLGRLLTEAGEADEGARQYALALEIDPENADVYLALADNALRRGRSAIEGGENERAAELFREAEGFARKSLAIEENLLVGHLNLGASLMEQYRLIDGFDPEKAAEALEHFDRVRLTSASNEDDVDTVLVASVNQCDALIQLGRAVDAVEVCQWVTRQRPDDEVAFYNLAGAYALAGRSDEALSALERDFELGDADHEWLEADEWFVDLRSDPRFRDLIARMKRVSAGR